MADVAPATATAPDSTKSKAGKVKKTAQIKKPANHPKYSEMLRAALSSLKERGGSSRQAILKYIVANYSVGKDERAVNNHLKLALRAGVKKGILNQTKGSGASGSFKLNTTKSEPKPKAKLAKKVKKPKSPGKAKAKKTSPVKKAASKKSKTPKARTGGAKKPKTKGALHKKAKTSSKKAKSPAKAKEPKASSPKKAKSPAKAKTTGKKAKSS